MKSLKILTCSLLLALLTGSGIAVAQSPSIRAGVYQFTDATASEFYMYAPVVLVDCEVWRSSQMNLQLTSGLSYNRIQYNDHYHYLYMVPFMATINYDLPNPGSTVFPQIGMGLTAIQKIDKNKDLQKTHHSLTGVTT